MKEVVFTLYTEKDFSDTVSESALYIKATYVESCLVKVPALNLVSVLFCFKE